MHKNAGELFLHRGVRPGQETGPHPVGDGTEPQIDAGGLDLRIREILAGTDFPPGRDQALQNMARQDAGGEAAIAVFV